MYKLQSAPHEQVETEELDTAALFSSTLLIEDDRAHAALIQRALAGIVGEITHASTGAQALDMLEEQLTEIVFCDLNLPDMAGIELIREIKRNRPGLPIIVLTSSSSLKDAVQAMREGAWDYMVKQFSDELRSRMRLTVSRTAERRLQQVRELRMRQERDAFWSAAYAAQDGLAILTSEGQVVFANESFNHFCCLLGGKDGQENAVDLIARHNFNVGRNLSRELQAESTDALWIAELEILQEREAEGGRAHYYELKLSNVSSGKAAFSVELPPLRYRVLWVRDITLRKEQERFQRDLLSTTTHDLKGPLAAILTSAELISESNTNLEPRDLTLMSKVASCARNAITIIDELLSARRIQDGVMVIKPRWLDADELLQEVASDYDPVARAKAIVLTAEPSGGLQIYADRLGLTRVLGNLVSNALKFTPKEGAVRLSAARIGTEVCITVCDTGSGIDPKAQHKLFQRFARLEKHSEIEGAGLGLFVAKNIVEAHSGRIEFKSQVGVGTSFTITFPDPAA